MPEGSDRKPKHGDAGEAKGKFEDVWDALVESASSATGANDEGASTRDGAHDATEPPSRRSQRTGELPASALDDLSEPKTAATKPWDEAARAFAKAERSREDASAVPSGDAPEPQKAGGPRRTPWIDRPNEWLERSDEQMERLMTEPPSVLLSAPTKMPVEAASASTSDETPESESAADAEEDSMGDDAGARPGGASTPEATPPAPPDAGAGRSRLWILLIAIFGLFGIWALIPDPPGQRPLEPTLDADRPPVPIGPAAEHPGGPAQPIERSPDAPPMIERGPHEGEPTPEVPEAEPTPPEPEAEPPIDEAPAERRDPPEPRVETDDLRTPPHGTTPEHAEAFARLPVGAGDGPPVGGVGERGVHVDHISLGSTYDQGVCGGKLDDFSISERDRVNVCLRVVHPREKEELVVLWQKDGDTIRRGKLTIAPTHAYRTRAYLMLREPYEGRWAVRILSQSGIELASHEFQIVR